jgi:N-acylglucosamine 2-epimerase
VWAKERAATIFHNIERRKHNPKGHWSKAHPGTRPFRGLAFPMIDINLCMEILELKDKFVDFDVGLTNEEIEQRMEAHMDDIFNVFHDKEKNLLRENVIPEKPETKDTFEGRLVNPGHTIECMWFLMNAARRKGRTDLIEKAETVLLATLEFGWDKEFGGFFYFMDIDGKPPQQLEWDQKLWWVHGESLVALALAYQMTKKDIYAEWYKKVFDYTWKRFPDPANGEWFGYLNRQGEVLLQLKGGKWKGCFHVPRTLYLCAKIFQQLADDHNHVIADSSSSPSSSHSTTAQ